MPSSYLSLHYHFIFSTKGRSPTIHPSMAQRLYDYIGGIVREIGGTLLAAGGMPDHVHLLCRLPATKSLADVLRDIKASSSKWIHDEFPALREFAWQTGYGAFTVSLSGLKDVKQYIADQEEHHRERTFQEEFVRFLRTHGIEYNEKYLWD
jgi:putative transposase